MANTLQHKKTVHLDREIVRVMRKHAHTNFRSVSREISFRLLSTMTTIEQAEFQSKKEKRRGK